MKVKLYVETNVLSLLVARRSKDPKISRDQAITRVWWRQRTRWELYSSAAVQDEVSLGDPREARKRLAILHTTHPLTTTPVAEKLAHGLISDGLLPHKANYDALHLGIAAVHDMNFLLTWNCKHLANLIILKRVYDWAKEKGYNIPTV